MSKRAVHRAHVEHLKKQRRFWWGRLLTGKELGRAAETPKPCSCWMCGNQSHIEGYKAKNRALDHRPLLVLRISEAYPALLIISREIHQTLKL